MASIYRVDFFSKTNGAKYKEIFDYLELAVNEKVNAPGMASIVVEADHAVLEDLEDYDLIEVYRKDPARGINWTREFGGIFVHLEHAAPDDGPPYATIIVFDFMIYLTWRIVAYSAGLTNKSKFSNAKSETVTKTLVNFNIGPSATDGSRKITGGKLDTLTLDTDQARGNSIYYSCAFKNLLEALQGIALIGGGDFNILRTSGNNLTFYWYPGQLGTDRRDEVTFSLARGNMRNPEWRKSRINERTKACVGLEGEADQRTFVQRTSGDYTAENHKEMFVDARDLKSTETSEANARADQRLLEYVMEDIFTFEIAQVEGCLYGVDYFLGDLVEAVNPFTGSTEDYKIVEVTLTCGPEGKQETEVEVERYV